ncbi:hypothetical protein B0H16DRAFT_1897501 [Mycena metata]|uniref:Uncharacterized protein n=1 Tax=Mycena metata TaxID=1033252 RepID=A0AAD7HE96_9AGAR|nr:hypothetical protein B0H16DRAFT_1897501 [Mycena metata]
MALPALFHRSRLLPVFSIPSSAPDLCPISLSSTAYTMRLPLLTTPNSMPPSSSSGRCTNAIYSPSRLVSSSRIIMALCSHRM